MTALSADADPVLGRLAEAILIPPFPGAAAPRWLLSALSRGLAGVTLFGPNIAAPQQVAALTSSLRAAAARDLSDLSGLPDPVIAIDEEGGDVTRVAFSSGSPYPGNAALGAVDDVALTQAVYRAIGLDLAALGINFNLAPCADVLGSADSPVVGTRSFGADTDLVSRHTAAAVAGLQGAGVAACAKHFPGHGRTGTDTHLAMATIEGGLTELYRRDLPPFAAAIQAGTIAVMPSHLRVPADRRPARQRVRRRHHRPAARGTRVHGRDRLRRARDARGPGPVRRSRGGGAGRGSRHRPAVPGPGQR
jgi:beta-N-acetylhexosaminidase